MKPIKLLLFLLIWNFSTLSAQQFISIDPDSALQGETLTTLVSGTGFSFLSGASPPSIFFQNFYMVQPGQINNIYPYDISIIDENNFIAEWVIPGNANPGNYDVEYFTYEPIFGGFVTYQVPGGFDVLSCPIQNAFIFSASATTFCEGDSVQLYTNSASGLSYQWYKSNTPISGATDTAYYAGATGSYRVKITNQSGCTDFSTFKSVTVHPYPNAIITPSSSTAFCVGDSIILEANGGSGHTYQWYKYGNPIPGGTNKQLTVSTNGKFKVEVTKNGCTTKSNATITYAIPYPSAIITPQGPTTFCKGTDVTLSANAGAGYTYQWYKYGKLLNGITTQDIIAKGNGKYKVLVTDSVGCSRKSAPTVTTALPLPPAQISAAGPTTFCDGDSVLLQANTGPGLTHQWKRYSNLISGATVPDYMAKIYGGYKVLVTDSNGCVKASNKIIVDVPCRLIQEEKLTGIDEVGMIFTQFNRLYINAAYSGPVQLRDMNGKSLIYKAQYTGDGIDISKIRTGIYIVILEQEENSSPIKIFIPR